MKLERTILANAFALATAILWVICSLIIAVLPGLSWTVSNWWAHGLLTGVRSSWSWTLPNFLLGGVTLTASAWVMGYVFGWSWEKMSKK